MVKFLEECKYNALTNKDVPVPNKESDLYQAQMWALGVVQTLKARGYKIIKDNE